MKKNTHRDWGAIRQTDGSTRFRVWAPGLQSLELEVDIDQKTRSFPMRESTDGFWEIVVADCGDGARYRYHLPTGAIRPDPASRFQPDGVHGWSHVVDLDTFQWHDAAWRGVAKRDLVIYELHIGCFTAAGTYLAAISRLNELVELGVTAIELMPLAQSPGRWNWGYDGVGLFAPHSRYGSPDELRRLIDAAHTRGLAVLLDVVYNHFGPEGNYWGEFGPYLSNKHSTPWGSPPNFDGDASQGVRNFFVANTTYWLDEFHFDGLRVDALHCMVDESDPHIVTQIGDAVAALKIDAKRELHLIAESNVYDPEVLQAVKAGGHGWDALWCDDCLQSVFAILWPGQHMSSRSYHPHADLDLTLRRGFVFQGTLRQQRRRLSLDETASSPRVSIGSLVYAIQNHDFVGNHPQGRRLHQLTSPAAQRAAAALLLLSPAIPMLFMGEEFASDSPFFFFVDFGDQHLREAVERGRQAEHPQHDWTDVESPLSTAAFERSKIGTASDGSQEMLDWYRRLIALRRQWKDSGHLRQETMSASWNEAGHFALLIYGDASDRRFVVIRLHAAGDVPRRIRLRNVDEMIAHAECDAVEDMGGSQWILGAHAVAVGRGDIIVDSHD